MTKVARAGFAAIAFLSAFLLFQIQPIIARFVLPRMGGGAAVWTTSMLFFQVALLAGYAYAHWIGGRFSPRVHLLWVGVLALLPLRPAVERLGTGEPVSQILRFLTGSVGLPVLALAITAPLLQRWYSLRWPDRSPYWLYAMSNGGSLLALVSYPFVVEPYMRLQAQTYMWSALFAVFAAGIAWVAWTQPEGRPAASVTTSDKGGLSTGSVILIAALAMCGSTLLLATTNQMCQEVAVIPLLWVVPLAIYLLTFILCFESERWYHRATFAILAGLLVLGECAMLSIGIGLSLWLQIAVYCATLFATCMLCHGEIARLRPEPERLTAFYLAIAVGGALGGIFTAIVAPRVFTSFVEYPAALAVACVLGIAGWLRGGGWREWRSGRYAVRASLAALLFGAITPFLTLNILGQAETHTRWRNFYGVLKVELTKDEVGEKIVLTHGATTHGFEYRAADKRLWPTSYYGPDSAAGLVFREGKQAPRRVGVIGLGAGTLAAHGQPGDRFRFYEINPQVLDVARNWFAFLGQSPPQVEVALGDARVVLERELYYDEPQHFDFLFVDAFSSDSIPLHLLTAECAEVYRRHLNPDGLLLLHISNRWVNLRPVARGMAQRLGWECAWFASPAYAERGESYASWVVLTPNREFLKQPAVKLAITPWNSNDPPPMVWTDDFASLWKILK